MPSLRWRSCWNLLQVDLAIPSLGHRKALMRAIHDLRQHNAAQNADAACNKSLAGSPSASPARGAPQHVQVSLYLLDHLPSLQNSGRNCHDR